MHPYRKRIVIFIILCCLVMILIAAICNYTALQPRIAMILVYGVFVVALSYVATTVSSNEAGIIYAVAEKTQNLTGMRRFFLICLGVTILSPLTFSKRVDGVEFVNSYSFYLVIMTAASPAMIALIKSART